jgi:hypothetical protein
VAATKKHSEKQGLVAGIKQSKHGQCYKTFFVCNLEFFTKLECLLDKAGKACHRQTLSLIMKFINYSCKKFYNIGSRLRGQTGRPKSVCFLFSAATSALILLK